MIIKKFYLAPEVEDISVSAEAVLCTSPSFDIPGYGDEIDDDLWS